MYRQLGLLASLVEIALICSRSSHLVPVFTDLAAHVTRCQYVDATVVRVIDVMLSHRVTLASFGFTTPTTAAWMSVFSA
ncbi:hypothetical protein BgiBS90_017466 [Biomphalaria glabrata]|nr:hypothetical protein BgiBS90_017466 [Biomphalaria glabrata]